MNKRAKLLIDLQKTKLETVLNGLTSLLYNPDDFQLTEEDELRIKNVASMIDVTKAELNNLVRRG